MPATLTVVVLHRPVGPFASRIDSSTAVTVLSLSAFLFIVIGMFAAAIVIGTPFGYAENLIVRATSRHLGARWARLAIIVAGVVLLVAEVLATFLVATWTFVQVNTVW